MTDREKIETLMKLSGANFKSKENSIEQPGRILHFNEDGEVYKVESYSTIKEG